MEGRLKVMGIRFYRSGIIMSVLWVSIVILLNIPSIAYSQTSHRVTNVKYFLTKDKKDINLTKDLVKKAQKEFLKANYNQSLRDYKKLARLYVDIQDKEHQALSEAHIAHIYAAEGKFKKATIIIHKINDLLKNHYSDFQPLIVCNIYEYIGGVYQMKEDNLPAYNYYNKALQTYQKNRLTDILTLTRIFNAFGSYYDDQGKYKKSKNYLQQALVLGLADLPKNAQIISDIYDNLGIVNTNEGNYKKALHDYKKDLKISTKILGKNHPDIGVTYNNIGNIYSHLSDYDNALEYYNKTLRIFLKHFGPDHPKVAIIYNNLGAIYYFKKNYNRAIEYFRRSLKIKLHALGAYNNNVATAYLNIGSIYDEKKDYNDALSYFKKALEIKLKIFGDFNPRVASTYDDIGNIYQKKKQYGLAIKNLARELEIDIKTFGFNNPYTASTLFNIGDIYRSEKKFSDALDFYQRGIMSLVPNFHNENINYNPTLKDIRSQNALLQGLNDKAHALYLLYNKKTHNVHDLKLSVETYNSVIRLINKIREGYKTKGSKLLLGERSYKIYEKAINAALELYDKTGNTAYEEQAFSFSEFSKYNVLLESIIDSKAKKFAGIPNSLLRKERKLKKKLTYYNNQLQDELSKKNKSNSNKINYLQDKLFAGNRTYHAFIRHLEKDYPKYYHLKYDIPKISISHIQHRILDKHTAIISYFKGDTTLYIFVITRSRFQVYSRRISKKFGDKIIAFRKSITHNNYSKYAQNAYRLYRLLIKPENQLIRNKRLIIIPDGILGYLPFETLLSKKPPKIQKVNYSVYRKLSYLILNHTISYTYSIPLLEELQNRRNLHDSHEFLGMAPVFNKKNQSTEHYAVRGDSLNHLSPLPASAQEIKGIYKLFEKHRGFFSWLTVDQSEIYLRKNANESILKSSKISDYKYIHLATHAFIDEKNPNMSGVILAHTPGTKDGGVLYASQIYNLNLHARLVVLSACETALGKFVKGEGIMGLSRAFIYAGANNLVVSLWNVSDRSTARLMIKFYSSLLKQHTIYSSLCIAKRYMIRKTQYAAPFYWSPFILIGDN